MIVRVTLASGGFHEVCLSTLPLRCDADMIRRSATDMLKTVTTKGKLIRRRGKTHSLMAFKGPFDTSVIFPSSAP
jgi:hypothetical protein